MDDSVLPYFMEYMQKHNATNLLNFWLTAETFRLSTINRLRINSMSRLKSSSTSGSRSEVADQSCILDGDNNKFGDFTGYEPEGFTSSNPTEKNSSEALLLCKQRCM